jgi:dihydropteroate synthase
MAVIMGVLNMTPDSFYEGSRLDYHKARERAHEMVEAGASIIDIGGESTRPGAQAVSSAQECDRVLPILEALAKDFKNITLSIDTRNPEVMLRAIDAGATLINDINALQGEIPLTLLEKIKQKSISVCLMHMQGQPQTMQVDPHYDDILSEVKNFLGSRYQFCLNQGIKEHQLIIDPGFGFGKTADHNEILLKNLKAFKGLGGRLLVGLSRKSFIGKWLEESNSPLDRLEGSLAAAVIAVLNGADIIRTHDVKATTQVVKIAKRFQL